MNNIAKVLIIAGSDPSGGAGMQADIKTASAHKVYASGVITCLTAQNTQKVSAIYNPPIDFLRSQMESVLEDMSFDAIKIGMLSRADIITSVADILHEKAANIPVILDTVMVATSGDLLLEENAVEALKTRLMKGAYMVTPNIDEAQVLANMPISNLKDMQQAALKIQELGCQHVLIKGGHLDVKKDRINNLLLDEKGDVHIISNQRMDIDKIHGTGCSLASAIACNVAKKMPVTQAVKEANDYVSHSISHYLEVGKGSVVLQHF